MRLMQNFGFAGYDRVVYIGTNGKMQELSAALGLTNLDSLDEFLEANRRNDQAYRAGLACTPGIRLLRHAEDERHNFQYVVAEVDEAGAGISRDELLEVLWAENVLARRYFYPGCHRMEPYRSYFPNAGLLLPETERLAERVLVLPTGTSVAGDDVRRICAVIDLVVRHGGEVRHRLGVVRAPALPEPGATAGEWRRPVLPHRLRGEPVR
jgi:dTDP-4-amino-4,6-dideoxygalactose transaminase